MTMEPLNTDEKIDRPIPREKDMDSQMIVGCTGFVTVSFLTYFLCVWPFLVWLSIDRISALALSLAAGYLPAFVVGAVAARKFSLPGGAGFVGGILAASIFLYLRFEQAFLEALARRSPVPEYPQAIQYIVPLAIVLAAVLIVLAFLDRKSIGME